ncbi:MAG: hypothetical protein DSY33_01350, partial [Archaeoglobus sp.]
MPSLRELWRISGYFYRDIVFRSIYEMHTHRHRNLEKVVRSAKNSMLINKILLALMLSAMAIYTAFRSNVMDFVIFYAMVTFLLAFFFLQATTSFATQSFDLLYVLPLSRDEVSKVISLTFFRIFDIPIIAVTIIFPIAMIVKSPVSSVPAFVGLLVSESFAIGLVVYLSRLFYSKIATGSGWKSVIRVFYYVVWAFTFFAFYAFASTMGWLYRNVEAYSALVMSNNLILSLVYPFCFAFPSSKVYTPTAFFGMAVWSLLAYLSLRWAVSNITEIFAKFEWEVGEAELKLKISNPTVAFLKKDIRLISRSPALCFLVLLPVMEGLLLSRGSIVVAIMVISAFLVMVAYSLHGLEKEGIARTLPIKPKTVIIAKTLLVVVVYLISVGVVDVVFALRGKTPNFPVEISTALSVFAMSVIVLIIAEKMGVRRDLYSGLSPL